MADVPLTSPAAGATLTVPRRFRGPARSGNGGWTSGALAHRLGGAVAAVGAVGAVEVMLRRPPPLDTPMTLDRRGTTALSLVHDGEVVAEAVTVARELTTVAQVAPGLAREAMARYPGLRTHPFPECFACGPARPEGDGLRVFPGPVPGRAGTVASQWIPHASLTETAGPQDAGPEDGGGADRAGVATTWAALDCVGGWSEDLEGRPCVLGRMTARLDALPAVGEPHVLVGELRAREGRKSFTAATLYDSDGRVVASAEHVWIAVDPAAFS